MVELDLKRIRALVRLAKDENLAEIEYQKGAERIRLRLAGVGDGPLVAQALSGRTTVGIAREAPAQSAVASSAAHAVADSVAASLNTVVSPFVGTFYRAASPGAPPFVDVGSLVKRGQTLCIVEAMKLMNEIESDCDGRVADILVSNGEAVEYGEPLFKIEPVSARA